MAGKVLITPEQYLATHFEREPELVHGELVEKSLPKNTHSKTQQRLCVLLDRAGECRPELRMKLAEDLFRIPDFALFEQDPDELPESPPLLIVEIASPDDRLRAWSRNSMSTAPGVSRTSGSSSRNSRSSTPTIVD
jgi:Uma2 family endonuclease